MAAVAAQGVAPDYTLTTPSLPLELEAAPPVALPARLQHRGDRVVDAEELMVLPKDLREPALVLREEREVPHETKRHVIA